MGVGCQLNENGLTLNRCEYAVRYLCGEYMRDKIMTLKEHQKDTISICEYFATQIDSLKEYIDLRFNSIETSTKLAQDNLNTRLESMNEFRMSLKDQSSNFITRVEHEAMMAKYDFDIRVLREIAATNSGKASMNSVYTSYAIALVGIVMGIAGLLLKF